MVSSGAGSRWGTRVLRCALAVFSFVAVAAPASAAESPIAGNEVVSRSAALVADYWVRVAPERTLACGQAIFRWVEPAPEGWGDGDGWAHLGGCTIWLRRAHWRMDRPVHN